MWHSCHLRSYLFHRYEFLISDGIRAGSVPHSCHNSPLPREGKMTILAKLKAFDHYRRSALIILPISFALLMYLILVHGSEFLLPEWFLDLIIVPAFSGNLLSGTTYIGRAIDLVSQKTNIKEKIGTYLGIGIGLGIAITAAIMHESIPLLDSLSHFAMVIFTLSQVSIFAGFGNRIGSTLDKTRLPNEQKAIGVVSLIGIALGLGLFLTSSVALVSVVGITSFVTGGAALPVWLGGILFVSTFSSSLTSFADYSTKAFNFIKSKFSDDKKTRERVKERPHEYRGSFCGSSAGFIVGIFIVGALLATQPHVFAGACGVIAATIVITTSVNVLGGLCSRIGRLFDGFNQKKIAEKEKLSPKPEFISSPTHMLKMFIDKRPSVRLLTKTIEKSKPITIKKPTCAAEAGLYRPSSVDTLLNNNADRDQHNYKRFKFNSV